MAGERDQEMVDGARQTRAEIAIGKLEVTVASLTQMLQEREQASEKHTEERRAWQDMTNVVLSQIRLDIQRSADAFAGHLEQSRENWADARAKLRDHEQRIGVLEKAVLSKVWLQDGWKIVAGLSGWAVAILSTLHFLKVIP